jgi:hypothetical protein
VVTSLDGGDWQLRGCLGDEWRRRLVIEDARPYELELDGGCPLVVDGWNARA